MRRPFLLGLLLIFVRYIANAVPASPYPFVAQSADGDSMYVTVHGDEYCHWYSDSHGEMLVSADGCFRRATESEKRALRTRRQLSGRRVAERVNVESSFPKKGSVKVIVLLVQYADKQFTVDAPVDKFSRFFNEQHYSLNGSTGSVRDYYLASSSGALDLSFDVYGPFTLSENEEYYGGNTSSSSNKNAQALVREAVQLAYNAGVNLHTYDNTGRGQIDNISVITAGHSEAEGGGTNSIWPHQSTVWNSVKIGDVYLGSYLMTSELRGATGSQMSNIGVYCHEFGHVLGLPDFYNTKDNDSETKTYTVGTWDIMCSGPYNNISRTPPTYCAFERFAMGWLTPEQLLTAGQYSLEPIESGNKAYLVAASTHNMSALSPSPTEYFMIENRQHVGWDSVSAAIPGTGLLVSHITFSADTWKRNSFNDNTPLGYDIVEAANPSPSASTPSDTYPGAARVSSWVPELNSGHLLTEYAVSNIFERRNGSVMFNFGDSQSSDSYFDIIVPDTIVTTFDKKIIDYEPVEVIVTGKNIYSSVVKISVEGSFRLSLDGETWAGEGAVLTDSVPLSGAYSRVFYMRHQPIRQTCRSSKGVVSVFSGDSSVYANASVAGISPRPVYIQPTDSVYIDDVTSSSLRVNWTAAEDAELYYIALYSVSQNDDDTILTLVTERDVSEPATQTVFSGLKSNTLYQAVVVAWEQKSCYVNKAEARVVTAKTSVVMDDVNMYVSLSDDGSYNVMLSETLQDDYTLSFFSSDGTLVTSVEWPKDTRRIAVPDNCLVRGELYLIKLYSGSFKRKNLWSKFIY